MKEKEQYMISRLEILSDSLDKKTDILKQILALCETQAVCIELENPNWERFDSAVTEKERLLDSLLRLDSGFTSMYRRLSEELMEEPKVYEAKIGELRQKIRRVTDLDLAIQTRERRNKSLVEDYVKNLDHKITQAPQATKSAYDRYKNMYGMGHRKPDAENL